MKDNIVEVKLWGDTVGLLTWDNDRGCAVFQFDKSFVQKGIDIAPLVAPVKSPLVQKGFPIIGNRDKLYGGLPEFISDSLPDRWGNIVFQKWVEANNLRHKDINAVDRLSFIGRRAMGALEFHPAQVEEDSSVNVELKSLYELANKIFRNRQNFAIDANNGFIIEDLYKVGTSAGGQRPKAIVAIDENTGTIRSGQADLPPSFTHYILKFGTDNPNDFPFPCVEMAYWLMAKDAGIDMMPSRLIEINGTQNFLTQRFDRIDGKKIHTQTMAAMSPMADTYEDLFVIGRKLGLTPEEQTQQYRRMVFNVIAENVDDHTKNFSFTMTDDGRWHLSPAYDMIFSADPDSHFFRNHEIPVNGKRKGITKKDLLDFAAKQDVKNAAGIIDAVTDVVANFRQYAGNAGIDKFWTDKIDNTLRQNADL